MSIYTRSERQVLIVIRVTVLVVCAPVLVLYALGYHAAAVIALPILALGAIGEGYALVRRIRWTMRPPGEIARERRERQERGED
jgi:hypothetical protein